MKIFHFASLIFQAFKNHSWAKVSKIHQTSNGWAFVVDDLLNDQSYICIAYPIKSEKIVAPNSFQELMDLQGN